MVTRADASRWGGKDRISYIEDQINFKGPTVKLFPDTTSATTGNGIYIMTVRASFSGWRLADVIATVSTAPTGAQMSITVTKNGTGTGMLSTSCTIDTTQVSSETSAVKPVVNTANATVATGDKIWINVPVADSNAADRGLEVTLVFTQ